MKIKELFRLKVFWILCIMMLCAGASEQAVSQWASTFAETGLGISKTFRRFGWANCVCGFDGAFQIILRQIRASHKFRSLYDCQQRPVYFILSWHLSFETSATEFDCLRTLRLVCGHHVPGTFSKASSRCQRVGRLCSHCLLAGDLGCSGGPTLVGMISDQMGTV